MRMRDGLPYVLALLLGISTALLAACGGGTTGGVPSASAGELRSQITDVGQAVDGGRCDEVPGQLRQVDEGIDQLPETTDDQLVDALRDGADRLRQVAIDECEDGDTETTTQPPDTETTETLPEDTETTETAPTETTEPPTTTAPPPPATPPPAPQPQPPVTPTPPPPQPPVTPGGGVTPEIPPDD